MAELAEMANKKYRLVTRSDFDGLVCAVLLKELDMIDDILFVHPKDMQDGVVDITDRDITTNLPYVAGCHMCFDHHESEVKRAAGDSHGNQIIDPDAPSAARVVYDHFGGKTTLPDISNEMMEAVDKADSAQFSIGEILRPKGWVLLNYLMDSRTGLGRFRDFTISNYELMMQLIEYCRKHNIDEILQLPDVRERSELYNEQSVLFEGQLKRCATVHGNLVVLDLRNEDIIYAGNRFMIYAMFSECNISIHAIWGRAKLNSVFAIGGSIVNRTSRTNIGELCLSYDGGGHHNAGTCQVANEDAERVLGELVEKITSNG
jgi:nanoRNase/pAp phosphatase (c-di-AMP/oligoRNAs hydrolase)